MSEPSPARASEHPAAGVGERPAVSVIVPARDAAATLPATLAGLAEQDLDRAYEVIVVDAGSSDATAALAEEAGARVLRREPMRAGAARNEGAAAAAAAVLAFVDADCRPEPGWLRAGLAAAQAAELVQGYVAPPPEAAPGPFDRTIWVTDDHGLHETANLFVDRTAFEAVGGFEDWAVKGGEPLQWGEDAWLGWRLRRAGARVAFASEAVVRHAVFERGPGGYIAWRTRAELFPALVQRVPELRGAFLRGRLFLSPRSAAFDAALAGAIAALALSSPVPALAAAPYVTQLARSTGRWGRRAPLVAAVELAADAVTLASLVKGSIRARTIVL